MSVNDFKYFMIFLMICIVALVGIGFMDATSSNNDIQVREVNGKEVICVKAGKTWDCKLPEDLND